MSSISPLSNNIWHLSFNQDGSCFSVANGHGFGVFLTNPYEFLCDRELNGGIGLVHLLYKTNVMALVGGGLLPKYPTNKIVIWDDYQLRSVGELGFRTDVKEVVITRERLAVVLEMKIYYYALEELKLLEHYETCYNPKGVCGLVTSSSYQVLAFPDKTIGHIRIQLYHYGVTTLACAHETSVACLALNPEGTLVSTTCDKGTVIRIFSTSDGLITQELRRGIDKAVINCLAFDKSSSWLACCSEKETVHIYAVKKDSAPSDTRNPVSALSFMRGFLPSYFDSQWSFAQLRVSDQKKICAFGPEPGTIIVLSYDGVFYFATFNQYKSGLCTLQVAKRFSLFGGS